MNSLCNQTYPSSNHHIIVVDGDSTDGTPEIVKKYIENLNEGQALEIIKIAIRIMGASIESSNYEVFDNEVKTNM